SGSAQEVFQFYTTYWDVYHLLVIQNLADHLDTLANEIPQSEEEAEDLHTKAAALRIWVRAAKTKIPSH
ncbi:MAG: hypothetical protein JSS34_07585, partial [Proteobacteria bacterium]|nr:hypothetical protein [Pseudomonadota bacterium]